MLNHKYESENGKTINNNTVCFLHGSDVHVSVTGFLHNSHIAHFYSESEKICRTAEHNNPIFTLNRGVCVCV